MSELRRDPDTYPLFILVSDGRANVCLHGESALKGTLGIASHIKVKGIHSTVIDTEVGAIRFGFARQISDALGASQPASLVDASGFRTVDERRYCSQI